MKHGVRLLWLVLDAVGVEWEQKKMDRTRVGRVEIAKKMIRYISSDLKG
jgi:hypothetical protein